MHRALLLLILLATAAVGQPDPDVVASVDTRVEAALDAEDPDRGLPLATAALEDARRVGYARGVARALYAQALCLYDRGESGTPALFDAAARAARRVGDTWTEGRALLGQGDAIIDTGDTEAGLDLLRRGFEVHLSSTTEEGQRAATYALNRLADNARVAGHHAESEAMFRRALERARSADDLEGVVYAAERLSSVAIVAGDVVGARAALDEAAAANRALVESGQEPFEPGWVIESYAEIDAALGRIDEAVARYRSLAEATSDPFDAAILYLIIGDHYLKAGRPDDALEDYHRGGRLLDGDDAFAVLYEIRVGKAMALFELGRIEEGRRELHPAADSVLAVPPSVWSEADTYLALAREARLIGRPADAVAFARLAVETASRARDIQYERDASAELAAALEADGRLDQAMDALRRTVVLSDSLNDRGQALQIADLEAAAAAAVEEKGQAARRARLAWGLGSALALAALTALGAGLYLRTFRRKNAEIEAQAAALEDANSSLAQTNGTLAEINGDLEVANHMLADARETQARSFQAISHEVRTPLTLAAGPVADLARGLHGTLPDAALEAVGGVQRSLSRLGLLIDDLLDAARLDAGQAPHTPEPGDLAALVRRTAATFEAHAEREELDLEVVTPDLFPATFDPVAMERALGNLLANAIRHTPPRGRVAVALEAGGGTAQISVSDTGPGVPADHLPHLFDRFYRADERAGVGSGLGLSLANEWMAHHGGRVEVESTPGRGATFTLVLPVEDDRTASGDSVSRPSSSPTGEPAALEDASHADDGLVVLVAEDNAEVRAYVASHLARTGGAGFSEVVRVLEAADGEAALEVALEAVPDLVVSDVMMPRLDGVALTAALKADARTSHVPVLLLTARADADGRVAGFEAGADGYLSKPFDPEALRAQAAALVAERRRLRNRFSAHSGDGADLEGVASEPVLAPLDREFVRRVDAQIADRIGDGGFGASQLAADLGLSERQLRRKLKSLTGETPGVRLRRMRVEVGAGFLEAGTHSVKEAAAAVGYADAEGFRRAFVALQGRQPSEVALEGGTVA